jgi:hypothetical protein
LNLDDRAEKVVCMLRSWSVFVEKSGFLILSH